MDAFIHFISEPFAFDFMRRAFLMSALIGAVCAIFSCLLVLKGWSLMGDAVSHAVLPGIGVAYILGLPLALGAFVTGVGCAAAIGYIKDNSRVKEDTVMGVIFSGMFAVGLVLLTQIETDVHLLHILFGNVLGVDYAALLESGAIALSASAVMLVKRKDFMLYCFDPVQAKVSGLAVRGLHFALLVLLALTIVSALQTVGIILVVAMLIAPGATAFLITRSFDKMLWLAVGVALFSCFWGTWLSFHLDTATAPLIVLLQFGFFIGALCYKRRTSSVAGKRGITHESQ